MSLSRCIKFCNFLDFCAHDKKARMQCCCLEICVKWCQFYIVHIFQTERRSGTSRYHGSTFSRRQQNQRRRPTARRMAKNICLYYQTTTLHVHHAILYISLPSLHNYDMKLHNFTSPLYGVGEHNTKIVTLLFKT